MSEEAIPGNGAKMQKAADTAFYQWLGKNALPAAVGAALLFAGIVGGRVLATQDKMAEVLAAMQVDMAVMKNDIGYLKEKAHQ
jgi:hypothetical protein